MYRPEEPCKAKLQGSILYTIFSHLLELALEEGREPWLLLLTFGNDPEVTMIKDIERHFDIKESQDRCIVFIPLLLKVIHMPDRCCLRTIPGPNS